jgi:hypothetical protein
MNINKSEMTDESQMYFIRTTRVNGRTVYIFSSVPCSIFLDCYPVDIYVIFRPIKIMSIISSLTLMNRKKVSLFTIHPYDLKLYYPYTLEYVAFDCRVWLSDKSVMEYVDMILGTTIRKRKKSYPNQRLRNHILEHVLLQRDPIPRRSWRNGDRMSNFPEGNGDRISDSLKEIGDRIISDGLMESCRKLDYSRFHRALDKVSIDTPKVKHIVVFDDPPVGQISQVDDLKDDLISYHPSLSENLKNLNDEDDEVKSFFRGRHLYTGLIGIPPKSKLE